MPTSDSFHVMAKPIGPACNLDCTYCLNYLCPAYKKFFRHVDPFMKRMTNLLHSKRAPAEIMTLLRRREKSLRPDQGLAEK
jgi:sulfatase maturation enzyme AslB (radical SAM superfamily)